MSRFTWLLLAATLPAASDGPLAWKDLGDGRIELSDGGKPALVYNYGPQLKDGAPENRRRCCYIFPVHTPAGVSLLDDFPSDHWHHRGLFWSWPIVETEGKRYDIWMLMTAKHRSAKAPVVSASQTEARLETQNFWVADGRDIVREDLRLTVFTAKKSAREIGIELKWEAVSTPVTLRGSPDPAKSYGGLSARFAPRENTIVRADGEVLAKDEDLNQRRWAELEGVYGGNRAVLRITPNETNPGAPHQWCLRSYGFVGASFPGRTATVNGHTLEHGKPLILRFRIRVADLP